MQNNTVKNDWRSIRNRLRELRMHFGELTQQELADLVGVSRQTIIAVESGRHVPTLRIAFKIAQVFNTGIENIFMIDGGRM